MSSEESQEEGAGRRVEPDEEVEEEDGDVADGHLAETAHEHVHERDRRPPSNKKQENVGEQDKKGQ